MIEFRIKGIPCQIDYDSRTKEYTILDRKGYKAPWLERKIDISTELEIYQAIEGWLENEKLKYYGL